MTTDTSLFDDAASLDTFLTDDWQKRPRFLRAALGILPDLPDWRILCADDTVESRRVITDSDTYTLEHGPFDGPDPSLPWTVLIQDADFHAPALLPLLNTVRFVPRWRLEDIMMSVASRGGSVGPHVDAYDVFLVQAKGQRRWQIGRTGDYAARRDGGDLRLVEPFAAQETWTASPGDVLYLPPDVPHHGVATTDDCVTLSIGFRAPSLQEVAATLLAAAPGAPRYRDPKLSVATPGGHIDQATIDALRAQLIAFARLSDEQFLSALGELVTEPKDWLAPEPRDVPWPSTARKAILSPGSRVAFGRAEGQFRVFANGLIDVAEDAATEQFVSMLATGEPAAVPATEPGRALLERLWEDGVVDRYEEAGQ